MRHNRGWYRLVCVALALVLISTLMLSASCGSDGDKGGKGTPSGEGEVVKEALVLESKTQMIDSSGGSILLEDGISVVFPSGAIDSVAEMT
ncbi:MAG: hypothetical protein WC749_15905, partial [Dehalococcoidia bacterium]